MESSLGGSSLKTLRHVLTLLHRMGDSLFVEAKEHGLELSTVNATRSGFTAVTLQPAFFHHYRVHLPSVCCKVWTKSLLVLFKAKTEKQLERCRFHLVAGTTEADPVGYLLVQFQYQLGVVKTHKLHYEPLEEILHARYDKAQCPHAWSAHPRLLSAWLSHFSVSAAVEEITMLAGPVVEQHQQQQQQQRGWLRFRSLSEHAVSTEVQLDPNEFDLFRVGDTTDLAFTMKDFQALVTFAEACECTVHAHFDQARVPLLLFVHGVEQGFSCEMVLATVKDPNIVETAPGASGSMVVKGGGVKRERTPSPPHSPQSPQPTPFPPADVISGTPTKEQPKRLFG